MDSQLRRRAETLPEQVSRLRAMQRAGEVSGAVLRLRAYCGDEAAREVLGDFEERRDEVCCCGDSIEGHGFGRAEHGFVHACEYYGGPCECPPVGLTTWLEGLLSLAPERWVDRPLVTGGYVDPRNRENTGRQWLGTLAAVSAALVALKGHACADCPVAGCGTACDTNRPRAAIQAAETWLVDPRRETWEAWHGAYFAADYEPWVPVPVWWGQSFRDDLAESVLHAARLTSEQAVREAICARVLEAFPVA